MQKCQRFLKFLQGIRITLATENIGLGIQPFLGIMFLSSANINECRKSTKTEAIPTVNRGSKFKVLFCGVYLQLQMCDPETYSRSRPADDRTHELSS